MTVVCGCLARSVRDAARYYDVCAGFDATDPYSLPRESLGWEHGLGSTDLRGKRAVIAPTLGSAVVAPAVIERIIEAGTQLVADAGLELVDVEVSLPPIDWEWAVANQVSLCNELGDRWPDCEPLMTKAMAHGIKLGLERFDMRTAARVEATRTAANERMAALFDLVDVVDLRGRIPTWPSRPGSRSTPASQARRCLPATTGR